MSRRGTPTCCTGWKQVWDDCPVCAPDGPCREPEEADRIRRNSTRWWRWLIPYLLEWAMFIAFAPIQVPEEKS